MILFTVIIISKEDVEAKYYADGEDAFAMKRDLSSIAEQIAREKRDEPARHQKPLPGSRKTK